jgi:hypothetical protein
MLSCLALAGLCAVVFIPGALANSVKSQTFELDGNIAQNGASANPVTYDWANFFDSSGAKSPVLPDASRPGYTASSFVRDFKTKSNGSFDTSDASTFTIGSKDTLDISGWSCTPANNVTDKGDIMNAYAVAYTDPNSGHKFMFFGLERNANAGDANVAFWFLQGSASCPAAGGSFTGSHHNGDLLIVSAFTNGGSVSTIDAYEWQNGALNTTPVAHGQDCRTTTVSGDPTCATANTGTLSNIPWLTENKTDGVGHTLESGEFFEGGIDLSAPSVNLANNCFNAFIPDTRSSQSLTATLYDYAIGQLGECSSSTATSPVDATDHTKAPATQIPAAPANAAVTVQDQTTITVNGISSFNSSNTNNLSWHICGPTAATSTQLCDGTTGNVGVAVGSTSITQGGTYYSPTVTVTKAGRYCFRAEFAGDSSVGVPPSSDNRSGECFTVGPQTPAISTQAVASPVDFGQAVQDNATLSGTANEAGSGGPTGSDGSINPTSLGGPAQGNITFTLYKSDCTTLATGTGTNPQTVAINGNGTYGPVSFTPDAPGTYYWDATYPGDSPNTSAATDNSSCQTNSEQVVVRQKPTSITTTQLVYPQDSVTITDTISGDNLPVGGVVTFYLYGAGGGNTAAQNCAAHGTTVNSGGLLATFSATQSTAAHTFTADTNKQTSVAVSDNTTVYWRDTYDPKNSAYLGIQSDCVENTSTTFVNDSGPGSAFTP